MKPGPLLFNCLIIAVSAAAQTPRRPIPPGIGVYLGWVGIYAGDRLEGGARLAKQSGFQTIRVPLVSSVETDFGIGAVCHGNQTLADLTSLPAYARVLADRSFKAIFLTIWGDTRSYDACGMRDPRTDQHANKHYLDRDFYSLDANRDRMRGDYADLTYHLYRTYGGSGKVFGISNWEGDNELYCDSAWYYATNQSFRSSCDEKRKTSDVLIAYQNFLRLRQEGIEIGRERALREGIKDVSVVSVIEASALRFLKEQHLATILDDVIPFVPAPDYISYSAWESIAQPADKLFRDLKELQDKFKGHLIVGEFGFDRGLDQAAPEHAAAVIRTAATAHVGYVVWWQIFDQPPLLGLGDKGQYGLYDEKEQLTAVGRKVLATFATIASEAPSGNAGGTHK